jgi:Protein of unknown function (DUF3307)
MQIFFRAVLAIYLAHLLTDFVFQTHRLVERKRHRKFSAYAAHGIIHYLAAITIVGFVMRGSILSLRTHLVLGALVLIHLLIDLAKMELARMRPIFDGSAAYVSDQVLHLLTIVLAAYLLLPAMRFADLAAWLANIRNIPNKFLAVPVVYVAVVFGGGYLIRFLTRSLAEGVKSHAPDKANEQLQNAGLYIGWLERFLVVTSLLLQSPATVGLILTAKAIARYPEFKSERFAEYFLIGTLLSISVALVGGALLAKFIFGQIRFTG